MFCVSTVAEKLIQAWTAYAVQVGNQGDTERTFTDVAQNSIGYQQFIRQGLTDGLNIDQISDCWDLVQLNLLSIRG